MVERYLMGYRFIEVGVERQNESVTVDEATRNYARSCECCMKRGLNFGYDCDLDCPITIAHQNKLDTIITLRQLEHEMQVRKEQLRKQTEELLLKIKSIYDGTYYPAQLDEHNEELDKLVEQWTNLRGGR
jgi:hypothetical protein